MFERSSTSSDNLINLKQFSIFHCIMNDLGWCNWIGYLAVT